MTDPTPLHRAARAALAHLELLAGFQESPSLLIVELREGLGVDAEITNQKGKDMTPFEKMQADTMAQIAAMPDGRDRSLPEESELRAILRAVDHTLSLHGKVDADTPLHERIRAANAS